MNKYSFSNPVCLRLGQSIYSIFTVYFVVVHLKAEELLTVVAQGMMRQEKSLFELHIKSGV